MQSVELRIYARDTSFFQCFSTTNCENVQKIINLMENLFKVTNSTLDIGDSRKLPSIL